MAPTSRAEGEPAKRSPEPWPIDAARRFVLLYWLLYFPVLVFEDLPGFGWILSAYDACWSALLSFTLRVLGSHHVFPDTSELRVDSSYGYAHVAFAVTLALLLSAAWSIAERSSDAEVAEKRLDRTDEIVRVLVRYGLANAMFDYGAAKVLSSQFAAPTPERFVEPLAEWSRQTLLWTFMGASPLYTAAAGALECVGGALLFWRRTTTLGALLVAAAMANVALINFAYDVPIKIHSTHLLCMAIFLAWPDASRLARVLVLHSAADARSFPPHFADPKSRRVAELGKALFLVFFLVSEGHGTLSAWRDFGDGAPRPVLYGIWEVESFVREGTPAPAPRDPWRRIAVARGGATAAGRATLWRTNEEHAPYGLDLDESRHTLVLSPRGEGDPIALTYERSDADHLVLTGVIDGAETRIALLRVPEERFKLRRGFRWIRERVFDD